MEWFFSRETARFITQIGRTTTRNDVERRPAALPTSRTFLFYPIRNILRTTANTSSSSMKSSEKELNRSIGTLLCEKE